MCGFYLSLHFRSEEKLPFYIIPSIRKLISQAAKAAHIPEPQHKLCYSDSKEE